MSWFRRSLTHTAVVFLFLAGSSGSISAQELKDRELIQDFDLTTIQIPVEIVSIKLNGKDIQPGEKIKGDDNWLQGVSFKVKNISDKPISYLFVTLLFRRPESIVGFYLSYGVDFSSGESRTASSPSVIKPGESVDLVMTKEKYSTLLQYFTQAGFVNSFDSVPYYVGRVSFEGEPDVIWEGGNLLRRDPRVPGKFNIIERYVLPDKQK